MAKKQKPTVEAAGDQAPFDLDMDATELSDAGLRVLVQLVLDLMEEARVKEAK